MRASLFVWAVLLQSCLSLAVAVPYARSNAKISKRQGISTGNSSYAPSSIACPSGSLVRDSTSIGTDEADYVQRHLQATQSAWSDWLSSSSGPNLDSNGGIAGGVKAYTSNITNLPKVAIALSGGGLRATLNGLGYLQGLDSRNSTAVSRGTGGFLQLSSYVAGLSGGSWAVGSLAINDWPTVQTLQDSFNLSTGLLYTSSNNTIETAYITAVGNDLTSKKAEGYQISLIDYWGLLLSGKFVMKNTTSNTSGLLWSDIQQTQSFKSALTPFPLITMDQHVTGQTIGGGNGSVWEVNAFETGSWDQGIAAFSPTSILGSNLTDGMASSCVAGYDNFGYMIGLSSAIFNTVDLSASPIYVAIYKAVQSAFGALASDIVNPFPSIPNPFKQWTSATLVSSMQDISLVDGGEDGQAVPLVPLLQPARGVDLILAVDSGTDTDTGWPAGYSLYATYSRFANSGSQFGSIPVPKVPFVYTFINQGLNSRPTFFGCNSETDVIDANSSSTRAPIIAYIPNYPWTFFSNFSTSATSLTDEQSQSTIDNAFESATLAGITSGSEIDWPTCLACASLQRSFERSSTPIPDKCSTCMTQYCWSGAVNETIPSRDYTPQVGTPAWVTSGAAVKYTDGTLAKVSASWAVSAFFLLLTTICISL